MPGLALHILSTLFLNPTQIPHGNLWVIVPLSIAVAAAYKAIRVEHVKQLPREIFLLTLYILAGVVGVMLAGWAIITWT